MKILMILFAFLLLCGCPERTVQTERTEQDRRELAFKHEVCTSFMKKEGWFCESGKTKTHYRYCEFAGVSGQKVTCRCFARISVSCNPELYFSLPEFSAKLKELKEAKAEDAEGFEDL